ncbi:hypothetical protein C8R44DRAFT_866432 [Mycena epipterygia]|nr:hypothetical protein C8R44DRAFT_866432 [Mycena epipterygia]
MAVTKSAHAFRNPGKKVQTSRKRVGSSKASQATKALQTAERLRRKLKLEDALDAFFLYRNSETTRIAKENGRSETAIRAMLCNSSQFKATRAPNLRNAIIHDLSLKKKAAGDTGVPLRELQEDLQDAIDEGQIKALAATMDDEERNRVIDQLMEHRETTRRGVRATDKAAITDATQTAKRVGNVLLDLFERTGIRGIAIFSRGDADDAALPHCVDSDDASQFFEQVFNITAVDLLRRFEHWSCTQDSDTRERNDINSVRKEVVRLIQDGLRSITKNKKLTMSYVDYDIDIREGRKVELAGWPVDITMCSPAKVVLENARRIRDALRCGAIKWVRMTPTQHANLVKKHNEKRAATGMAIKKRATRSDKGKTRGSRAQLRKTKKAAPCDDESEDEESQQGGGDEEENDDEVPVPIRSRTASAASGIDRSFPDVTLPIDLVPFDPTLFDPSLFDGLDSMPLWEMNGPSFDFSTIDANFGADSTIPSLGADDDFPTSILGFPLHATLSNLPPPDPSRASPMVIPAASGGPSAASALVSSTVDNRVIQKKRRSTASDGNAPAPKKPRKERSDKGRKRGENELGAGEGVDPDTTTKKKRKERSDKGMKRART